jgi:hypothetical protein
MKRLNECGCNSEMDHSNTDNYMFFQNLKTIKKMVDAMLKMDPKHVDQILSNGHGWAADHIATSKDDVEEVGGFLMNSEHTDYGHMSNDIAYNSQQPQFVPVGFKDQLKTVMHEKIQKVDGGWAVYPSKGGKRLGTHPTKKAALKQLAAIEISKMKK